MLTIWGAIKRLAQDPIIDVRIGVARLIASATGRSAMGESIRSLTTFAERLYPRRARRWELMTTLLKSLRADEALQVRAFVSFLLDEDVTNPQGPSINESGFAIFSKPPRTTMQPLNDNVSSMDNQINDIITAVAERMDLDQVNFSIPSIITNPSSDLSGESPITVQDVTGMQSSSSSTPHAPPPRPSLLSADSAETAGSGTSRGEDSQPSPKANDAESPRQRPGKFRRNNPMTLGELPQGMDPTEVYQSGLLTATRSTPSPGSERRISFDGSGTHSDSDSSSSRIDSLHVSRRASLHRISSDSAVSVASG